MPGAVEEPVPAGVPGVAEVSWVVEAARVAETRGDPAVAEDMGIPSCGVSSRPCGVPGPFDDARAGGMLPGQTVSWDAMWDRASYGRRSSRGGIWRLASPGRRSDRGRRTGMSDSC